MYQVDLCKSWQVLVLNRIYYTLIGGPLGFIWAIGKVMVESPKRLLQPIWKFKNLALLW